MACIEVSTSVVGGFSRNSAVPSPIQPEPIIPQLCTPQPFVDAQTCESPPDMSWLTGSMVNGRNRATLGCNSSCVAGNTVRHCAMTTLTRSMANGNEKYATRRIASMLFGVENHESIDPSLYCFDNGVSGNGLGMLLHDDIPRRMRAPECSSLHLSRQDSIDTGLRRGQQIRRMPMQPGRHGWREQCGWLQIEYCNARRWHFG
jgi:hypothetical protein